MTTKKKTAEEAYIAAHTQACELVERIGDLLQDMPAPDNDAHPIHWGHVGDLEHANALLRELAAFLARDRQTPPPWKR